MRGAGVEPVVPPVGERWSHGTLEVVAQCSGDPSPAGLEIGTVWEEGLGPAAGAVNDRVLEGMEILGGGPVVKETGAPPARVDPAGLTAETVQ